MKRALITLLVCTLAIAGRIAWSGSPVASAQDAANWPQWGQNPQHTGTINVVGQDLGQKLADIVYDPLVPDEQAANGGELLAHYQVPIQDGEDVFMEFKSGDYSNPFNSQIWHEKRLHWEDGQLVVKWDFTTDWKPEPIQLAGWEPVFHAVLANDNIYVPGAGGTLFQLARGNGEVIARINPFDGIDANTFVAGPPTADSAGSLFYNVLRLDSSFSTTGSWLVKVAADNSTAKVAFTTLVPNAPTTCVGAFGNSRLPWPGVATAFDSTSAYNPNNLPPSVPCGPQRPGINVAPAVAPDGTIYTVSRADFNSRYSYVVAVNPDLTPKWQASMRDRGINDGCGKLIPIATQSNPVQKGHCRWGTYDSAHLGVDPNTNQMPAGRVIDQSSSSPTVLPDGSVLSGAYSRYNVSRGHFFKFSSTGQFLAAYEFGWDSTPAAFSHDGTYSIVIKDNHYDEEEGYYCNNFQGNPAIANIVCDFTGVPAGPFYITQLNANLVPEWKAHSTETNSCNPSGCVSDHPNGFEWCINAPVIDGNNTVYVESEDGNVYKIPQGQHGVFDLPPKASGAATRLFLRLALMMAGCLRSALVIEPMMAAWRLRMVLSRLSAPAAASCSCNLPAPGSMPMIELMLPILPIWRSWAA